MAETMQKERERFGLEPDFNTRIDPEQELESMLPIENEDEALSDLAWYIIHPQRAFYLAQNTQIQVITWISIIQAPVILVFNFMDDHMEEEKKSNLHENLLWLIWVCDISWCVEIVLNFFVASPSERTFKKIAVGYLKGFFIIDVLATIPPMLTMNRNRNVNLLKFLRLVHFGEMFQPVKYLVDCIMTKSIAKKRNDVFQLIVLFTTALLFGHVAACAWIALGSAEGGWMLTFKNSPVDEGGDEMFAQYQPYQVYVFSLYWVFTVLTTVGYGDYAGTNADEFIFSIVLEFCGLTFFALLTGLITPLVTPEKDFNGLLMDKTDTLDLWIKKIQQANSTLYNLYIPADLYLSVSETVEEAFKNDHNLIIEEFDFYEQLSPKMQTSLINLIFEDFRKNFRHFFDPCDQGFVNETIINLFSRRYPLPKNGRLRLVRADYKMEQIYFTMEGAFALYHPTLKVKGKHQIDEPAVVLSRYTVFGDYQLLFDLYPRMEFCPFVPPRKTKQEVLDEISQDNDVDEYRVMCLDSEVFERLCALYPQTAESLKIQGLKKRNLFINCLRLQEEEALSGKDVLSTIVYKGLMKSHSKYRDKLTKELEQDEDLSLQMYQHNNNTILSSQILLPEEQDVDIPDEKLESQLALTQSTSQKLSYLFNVLQPIIHDLKAGNLKRVANSTYIKQSRRARINSELVGVDNETSSLGIDSDGEGESVSHAKSRQQRHVDTALESERSKQNDRVQTEVNKSAKEQPSPKFKDITRSNSENRYSKSFNFKSRPESKACEDIQLASMKDCMPQYAFDHILLGPEPKNFEQ